MEIWTSKVGDDSLYLKCEDGNEHNKYAVAVMIGGRAMVGMSQRTWIKFLTFFLLFLTVASNVKSLKNVLIEKLDMNYKFRPSTNFLDQKKLRIGRKKV